MSEQGFFIFAKQIVVHHRQIYVVDDGVPFELGIQLRMTFLPQKRLSPLHGEAQIQQVSRRRTSASWRGPGRGAPAHPALFRFLCFVLLKM